MTESNVQPFEFRGNPVATVTAENGTVLFCAKHVATALGYSNTRDAIRKHCRHIDGVANRYPITDSLGRTQQAVFITEGDVYRLIASSKLPSAVEFEHWLFDEVVPQIRRTGGYIPQGETPEETMARAVLIAQKTIEEQRKQLDEQKPKVLFADAVATSKRSILIGELAKILKQNGVKTGQNRLFKQLREDGFLMKRNGEPEHAHTEEHGTGFVRGQGNIDCPFGWSCVVELHDEGHAQGPAVPHPEVSGLHSP